MSTLVADPFISAIFLFVGLMCMVLELFVPSGGFLGLLALASVVFGVYGLFQQGHAWVASGVIVFYIASYWMMVKLMIRRLDFKSSMTPETSSSVDSRIIDLVGKEGMTLTPLHPAGMALIEERKVDVVTLGDYIEKDVPIRVVDISGNRVVVRQVESRSMKA
jgi:membrane-bound serine protease (ClpP class)